MKVGLLGITGGVGGIFAKLALDKGHEIIALARTPSKVTLKHAKLKIIQVNSTALRMWQRLRRAWMSL